MTLSRRQFLYYSLTASGPLPLTRPESENAPPLPALNPLTTNETQPAIEPILESQRLSVTEPLTH